VEIGSAAFWGGLGSIVLANVVLSADNAVVIALASRALPDRLQRPAIVWGSAAAVLMRIALAAVAVELLNWPYVRLIAGALLIAIGVSLLAQPRPGIQAATTAAPALTLGAAVRTILLADLIMSLDNVLAVVAAAQGNFFLLMLGLALSIPLIVFGSSLMLVLMRRWPIIVTLAAALLGFLAAQMMLSDPALLVRWGSPSEGRTRTAALTVAALVVALGLWRRRRGASPPVR